MSERYLQYQDKMKRMGAFVQKLWRFRFLILCALVLLVAFIAAMAGVAGIVSDAEACPSEVLYGEELGYRAKAVFQSVRYEYRADGEETWTDQSPYRVGSYWVRAVSTGAGKTGQEHFFTILPREVSVGVLPEWEYGEQPVLRAATAAGDRAVCESFGYEFGDEIFITPQKESVKIYRGEEDVTDCYAVTTEKEEVTVVPRPLTVAAGNASKVYDGVSLRSEEYEISEGSLAFGDRLEPVFADVITEAGSMKNTPVLQIMHGQEDRTRFYRLKIVPGTLTVERRPLSVRFDDLEKVYDGTPLTFAERTLDSRDVPQLVAGHVLLLSSDTSLTDAGRETPRISYAVLNEKQENVTQNYDITVTAGDLIVTPRPLMFTIGNFKKEYDGTPLRFESKTLDATEAPGLALGHFLTIESSNSLTLVGKVRMTFNATVTDGEGKDVTKNYLLSVTAGDLIVTPRPIEVVTEDEEFVYDGREHAVRPTLRYTGTTEGASPLAAGEYYVVFNHSTAQDVFWQDGAPAARESFAYFLILNTETNEDMTSNYSIAYRFGTVKVLPRSVTISAADREWEYDGNSHGSSDGVCVEGELPEGHTIKLLPQVLVKNVRDSGTRNWFTATISDEYHRDVTNNYVCSYSFEDLIITPRPVVFSSRDVTWCYDGAPHGVTDDVFEALGPEVAGKGLLSRHTAQFFADEVTVTDVKDGAVDITFTTKIYEYEEEVTENYDISYRYGSLSILPRPVLIRTGDKEFVYDGMDHTCTDSAVYFPLGGSTYDFLEGHTFTVIQSTVVRNVTAITENHFFDFKITDRNGEDVTQNYSISEWCGFLKVDPRPITVRTQSGTHVYDGERAEFTALELAETSLFPLVKGDALFWDSFLTDDGVLTAADFDPENIADRVDVGEWQNKCIAGVRTADGKDVSGNYSIGYVCGTVTVTPRPITVVTSTVEFYCDGLPHSDGGCTAKEEGMLVAGHTLEAQAPLPQILYLTEKRENVFLVDVFSGTRLVSFNYTITYEYGTLSFAQRVLEIATASAVFEYDGTMHSDWRYTLVSREALMDGHFLVVNGGPMVRDVSEGKVKNTIWFTVWNGMHEDVTKYYKIFIPEDRCGTIEVLPRAVTVQSQSGTREYDAKRTEYQEVSIVSQTGLVGGHTLRYLRSVYRSDGDRLAAGQWDNVVEAGVLDENGRDVSRNYAFSYTYGKIDIRQRKIGLRTPDVSFVYDGQPHSSEGYEFLIESGSVAEGDFLFLGAVTALTEAGKAQNVCLPNFINAKGENVDACYSISVSFGTLSIERRTIRVVTGSEDFWYDRKQHFCDSFDYAGDTPYELVGGHRLQGTDPTVVSEVGSYRNTFGGWSVWDGDREVTLNYDVTVSGEGELTVRYKIVITLWELSKVYDGTPLSYGANDWIVSENLGDLTVRATVRGSITDVGTLSVAEIAAQSSVAVSRGGVPLGEDKYGVEFEGKPLTVEARRIEITSESAVKQDDGSPLSSDKYWVSFGTLIPGHILEVTLNGEQRGPGSSDNSFGDIIIRDAQGKDVTANYSIVQRPGTLTITE